METPATPQQDNPALERFFGVRAAGSRVKTEIVAGITTFLTAMYIIVVNPGILSQAGVPFPAALTATVIVSFLGSCAMGLYARIRCSSRPAWA